MYFQFDGVGVNFNQLQISEGRINQGLAFEK